MRNKKAQGGVAMRPIIIGIMLVIVLLIVGGYFLTQFSASAEKTEKAQEATVDEETTQEFIGKIETSTKKLEPILHGWCCNEVGWEALESASFDATHHAAEEGIQENCITDQSKRTCEQRCVEAGFGTGTEIGANGIAGTCNKNNYCQCSGWTSATTGFSQAFMVDKWCCEEYNEFGTWIPYYLRDKEATKHQAVDEGKYQDKCACTGYSCMTKCRTEGFLGGIEVVKKPRELVSTYYCSEEAEWTEDEDLSVVGTRCLEEGALKCEQKCEEIGLAGEFITDAEGTNDNPIRCECTKETNENVGDGQEGICGEERFCQCIGEPEQFCCDPPEEEDLPKIIGWRCKPDPEGNERYLFERISGTGTKGSFNAFNKVLIGNCYLPGPVLEVVDGENKCQDEEDVGNKVQCISTAPIDNWQLFSLDDATLQHHGVAKYIDKTCTGIEGAPALTCKEKCKAEGYDIGTEEGADKKGEPGQCTPAKVCKCEFRDTQLFENYCEVEDEEDMLGKTEFTCCLTGPPEDEDTISVWQFGNWKSFQTCEYQQSYECLQETCEIACIDKYGAGTGATKVGAKCSCAVREEVVYTATLYCSAELKYGESKQDFLAAPDGDKLEVLDKKKAGNEEFDWQNWKSKGGSNINDACWDISCKDACAEAEIDIGAGNFYKDFAEGKVGLDKESCVCTRPVIGNKERYLCCNSGPETQGSWYLSCEDGSTGGACCSQNAVYGSSDTRFDDSVRSCSNDECLYEICGDGYSGYTDAGYCICKEGELKQWWEEFNNKANLTMECTTEYAEEDMLDESAWVVVGDKTENPNTADEDFCARSDQVIYDKKCNLDADCFGRWSCNRNGKCERRCRNANECTVEPSLFPSIDEGTACEGGKCVVKQNCNQHCKDNGWGSGEMIGSGFTGPNKRRCECKTQLRTSTSYCCEDDGRWSGVDCNFKAYNKDLSEYNTQCTNNKCEEFCTGFGRDPGKNEWDTGFSEISGCWPEVYDNYKEYECVCYNTEEWTNGYDPPEDKDCDGTTDRVDIDDLNYCLEDDVDGDGVPEHLGGVCPVSQYRDGGALTPCKKTHELEDDEEEPAEYDTNDDIVGEMCYFTIFGNDDIETEFTYENYRGVTNLTLDRFPTDPEASQDRDWDGCPDEWNPGYENAGDSGLVLDKDPMRFDNSCGGVEDNDWDNDGVPNVDDKFFYNRYASEDTDLDGCPDRWNPGYGIGSDCRTYGCIGSKVCMRNFDNTAYVCANAKEYYCKRSATFAHKWTTNKDESGQYKYSATPRECNEADAGGNNIIGCPNGLAGCDCSELCGNDDNWKFDNNACTCWSNEQAITEPNTKLKLDTRSNDDSLGCKEFADPINQQCSGEWDYVFCQVGVIEPEITALCCGDNPGWWDTEANWENGDTCSGNKEEKWWRGCGNPACPQGSSQVLGGITYNRCLKPETPIYEWVENGACEGGDLQKYALSASDEEVGGCQALCDDTYGENIRIAKKVLVNRGMYTIVTCDCERLPVGGVPEQTLWLCNRTPQDDYWHWERIGWDGAQEGNIGANIYASGTGACNVDTNLLQRGDLGCEGDVLCPDGWTYTCTGGRNLVSCCPTDHTNICGCIPPAGQILQDDFETSKEDWSVAYSPMIMSGGRDPQPIPECNKNDFEWDEIELKSGAHSYYLKAGKNINIFAGGIVGARDCKTFITKTFEVDTPAGKTLSWWYKSEQGTNGKRFFNVYVNGNSVWSAQVDQVDEWQQESIVLGGGVTSPVTVKLEVFYDGAWSASTSGWFDKLEITEGGQEEFELPEIDCRQSACGKGMDCIEENNAWVCAENYEIYFCGGGAGSRRWDTDADCQARDGQDCEAVYFGACNAPNCDTYCTNTAGFVRGVTSGTRTGRTGDRYQCKCTDDQVFRGGNLG